MTIVLISSGSCFDRARSQVLELLLESKLEIWPSQGLSINEYARFSNSREFWLMPEARKGLILRFDSTDDVNSKAVFRPPDIQTWNWYLKMAYPNAKARLFWKVKTLSDVLSHQLPDPCLKVPTFSLTFLRCLFHDMKSWNDSQVCRRAAAWLSTLKQPVLFPFEFLQHDRLWQRWHSHPEWRRTMTITLNQFQNNGGTPTAPTISQYWMMLCLKYHTWSTKGISEAEQVELSNHMQLWKENIIL